MRNSTGPSRAVLAAAVVVAATWTLLPQPAFATDVGDWVALSGAFANPAGVGGQVELGADLVQGAAADLRLADGAALTLDLNGHRLDTVAVVLGAGSTLTLTDTTPAPATPGVLTAASPRLGGAGIAVGGATLVVQGRAVVSATARDNEAAGIGGDKNHRENGTVTITGDARVSAAGGQFSAGIGGGDRGGGGSVTISGNATVTPGPSTARASAAATTAPAAPPGSPTTPPSPPPATAGRASVAATGAATAARSPSTAPPPSPPPAPAAARASAAARPASPPR
ncbi:hypothetical protein [Kitasatospora phosalacinea]|nr:hypothetical protein [Kitasatospora phosalacinea]